MLRNSLLLVLGVLAIFCLGRYSVDPVLAPIIPLPEIHNEAPASKKSETVSGTASEKRPKDVILYSYYEHPAAARNLQFFVDHALHGAADFIFIINGFNVSVNIPVGPNIEVVYRKNECFDMGAYNHVISANGNGVKQKYDRFILMNASFRGPFFPAYAQTLNLCWSSVFFAHLVEDVKLVAATANCHHTQRKHLQSMLMATDKVGLELIQGCMGCESDIHQAAQHGEVPMTGKIIDAGYQAVPIFSIRPTYGTVDDFWRECDFDDPFYEGRMGGFDVDPYDTIFVKTKRSQVIPTDPLLPFGERGRKYLDMLTEWADKSKYSSYDYC